MTIVKSKLSLRYLAFDISNPTFDHNITTKMHSATPLNPILYMEKVQRKRLDLQVTCSQMKGQRDEEDR